MLRYCCSLLIICFLNNYGLLRKNMHISWAVIVVVRTGFLFCSNFLEQNLNFISLLDHISILVSQFGRSSSSLFFIHNFTSFIYVKFAWRLLRILLLDLLFLLFDNLFRLHDDLAFFEIANDLIQVLQFELYWVGLHVLESLESLFLIFKLQCFLDGNELILRGICFA